MLDLNAVWKLASEKVTARWDKIKKKINKKTSLIAIPILLLLILYQFFAGWYNNRPKPDPDQIDKEKHEKEKREREAKKREVLMKIPPCLVFAPEDLGEGKQLDGFNTSMKYYYHRGFTIDTFFFRDDGSQVVCFKYDGTLVLESELVEIDN